MEFEAAIIRCFGKSTKASSAGGLIRAYGGCAAECLRNASRRELIETTDVEFSLGFAALPLLHARLRELHAHKLGEDFVDDA